MLAAVPSNRSCYYSHFVNKKASTESSHDLTKVTYLLSFKRLCFQSFKFLVMPLYCLTKEEAVICDKKSISYNFLYISDLFPTGYCTKERLTVTRSKIMGQMSHPGTQDTILSLSCYCHRSHCYI